MNDVCGYCGKANGWHVWGCPGLPKFTLAEARYVDTDEYPSGGELEVAVVKTLPEVE